MSDQFISVPTMIKSRFRILKTADSPRLYAGPSPTGGAALLEESLAHARQNEAMIRFLIEMDKKLDAIMAILQRDSLAADFPYEGQVVQIGGSGLVLECRHPLKKGESMELLLTLEEVSLPILSVIARVIEPRTDVALSAASNKAYAMGYDCMSEEHRETLIRFVFSEQRKHIRRQKSGEDN
jgi:hypothetical protein